jgi:hypothetical protein
MESMLKFIDTLADKLYTELSDFTLLAPRVSIQIVRGRYQIDFD